jgi:DNA-binding transcriptional LysR family regulator
LTVPSYLQALHAAAASDLVAFVPKRLAEALGPSLGLAIVEPPIDPGTYQEFLFYPRRCEGDAASRWLRDIVIDIGKGVDARATGRPWSEPSRQLSTPPWALRHR